MRVGWSDEGRGGEASAGKATREAAGRLTDAEVLPSEGMHVLRSSFVLALVLGGAISVACGGERQSLVVSATAYNSLPEQTQGDPTVGAWGDRLRPGDRVIAVSPDLVELGLDRGTRVEIEGLRGSYRVLDRTHSRLERTIDIYMGTDVDRARAWGRRQVRITWKE